MKNKFCCNACLFLIGGVIYGFIELLWRKRTHWSMILTGGLCFTVLYRLFKCLVSCPLRLKCVIGSAVITFIEFFAGFVFNFCLKLRVWDYSGCRWNLCGQICPLYSLLWGLLVLPIDALCRLIDKKLGL